MRIHGFDARQWATLTAIVVGSSVGITACSSEDERYEPATGLTAPSNVNGIYPLTTLRETPQDFVDAKGHRWVHMGPAKLADETGPSVPPEKVPPPPRTREELAYALRGVMFFNGHEYRQMEPAYEMVDRAAVMRAEEISFDGKAGNSGGTDQVTSAIRVDVDGPRPATIFTPGDVNRWPTGTPTAQQLGCREHGVFSVAGGTLTRVSPSTALTAGHNIYNCGGWLQNVENVAAEIWFGADTPSPSNAVSYYLRWMADWATWIVPWQHASWTSGCNNAHHDWDIGVMDFMTNVYNDFGLGYMGVQDYASAAPPGVAIQLWTRGYPTSKRWGYLPSKPRQWNSVKTQAPWQDPTWVNLFNTHLDWESGNSGGCVFRTPAGGDRCIGWVEAQLPNINIGRKWDAYTFGFMDAVSAFPN